VRMAVRVSCGLTSELSDHGQRQQRLAFTSDFHRCPWFAPVILLGVFHLANISSAGIAIKYAASKPAKQQSGRRATSLSDGCKTPRQTR